MAIWNCGSCGEDNDSVFGVCWNCGVSNDDAVAQVDPPAPAFSLPLGSPAVDDAPEERELKCLRCGGPMSPLGRLRFHEGSRVLPSAYGQLGELLVDRDAFDAYACTRPGCGRMEFFAVTVEEVSLGE